jgi:anti-sigma regulatory factor (Ser/Thr protein kinase)
VRSGAAAGHTGYFHEAAFYASDEEFLAIVVPFLREGVAAGEPSVVTLGEVNTGLLRSALAPVEAAALRFVPGDLQYARPARAIRAYRSMFDEVVRGGAKQIRVVGDVPHPGFGVAWDEWARYEAAVNHTYGPFPVWGLCPYDVRTAPADVLADVRRTHPHVATADGGHLANPEFADPVALLRDELMTPCPAEPGSPQVELHGPTPAEARRALRALAAEGNGSLDESAVDDLLIAVSEAVDNAWSHGLPPVRLRLWHHGHRLVATVTDGGGGPRDPYAGLLPAAGSATAGLGLWMSHQMCDSVTHHRDPDGFTLRMTAGR